MSKGTQLINLKLYILYIYYMKLTAWNKVLFEKLNSALRYSRISPPFMKSEVLLPGSEEAASGP
jgi:hypothetical protein